MATSSRQPLELFGGKLTVYGHKGYIGASVVEALQGLDFPPGAVPVVLYCTPVEELRRDRDLQRARYKHTAMLSSVVEDGRRPRFENAHLIFRLPCVFGTSANGAKYPKGSDRLVDKIRIYGGRVHLDEPGAMNSYAHINSVAGTIAAEVFERVLGRRHWLSDEIVSIRGVVMSDAKLAEVARALDFRPPTYAGHRVPDPRDGQILSRPPLQHHWKDFLI